MAGIFDFHAHIYPEKIAAKATGSVSEYYGLPVACDGTVRDLVARCCPLGVRRMLVHSTATKAEQVRSINDFIIESCRGQEGFVGFGTLHRDQADIEAEIDRIARAGLRGIKLHPEFQCFAIDDSSMDPIYAAAQGTLPVLMHMGDERGDSSSPARLAAVLDRFPRLVVVAAHLGGYRMWGEAARLLSGRDL